MKWFWLINLGLFQASWLVAAFFTQYAAPIIFAFICLNFYLSPSTKADFKLLALIGVGICIDSLHFYLGTFKADTRFFPIWLIMLWAMFSISFNHSFNWFTKQTYWLLALVGAVGGTLSYWGGIKAGALSNSDLSTSTSLIYLALSWAIVFPLLVKVYRQLVPSDFYQVR
ncbi:hypothetical protein OA92_17855 [Marinomonas sp. SBI22]|uniref:DUF2878 domain-containing protein n=1 Tax=unclassified Marinomonas TaxID=196814 RepID=UPI0007AFC174|nr:MULTISPECIES: DUF2878 domain-containing protein [unclassified Marinomonas]KZM39939.1 hypothetical protein OA92_17855 [Marinomonas sp. SBI22]KZM41233.1 hypothetical protein OA91_17090 [Marinomonas sp. SBI8L]